MMSRPPSSPFGRREADHTPPRGDSVGHVRPWAYLNWARQGGLSFFRFLVMHAVMRGTSGISLLQNLKASCVQAICCSGVVAASAVFQHPKTTRATAVAMTRAAG